MNIEKIIEEAKRSVVHFKAHTAPGPLTVFTDKRARFARFSLQGKGVLHLTEIEIYTDDDVNVALRKPVTTSSMFGDDKRWLGSRVVDGKTSGPLGIHTKQENDPWVRIDLGKPYEIRKIIVFNRDDQNYQKALGLRVELSRNGVDWTNVFDNYHFLSSSKVKSLSERELSLVHASMLSFAFPRELIERLRSEKKYREANELRSEIDSCLESYGLSYTHHGFRKTFRWYSFAEKKDLLVEVSEFLVLLNEKLGVSAFISSGTLLGFVRDNDLIGHDDDIDLCYVGNVHEAGEVVKERAHVKSFLEDRGYRVTYSGLGHLWCFTPTGNHFDLFPGFIEDGRCSMNPLRRRGVSQFDVIPLRETQFMGCRVYLPRNPDAVLKLNFGEHWREPDPSWVFDWSHVGREYGFLHGAQA